MLLESVLASALTLALPSGSLDFNATVNPNTADDDNVPLGGTYSNPDTGEKVTHVDAKANQGYIF
ncbi:MAG: hypothetical protein AAF488_07100, partial [Planctomycetota bacterium]